MRHHYVVGTRLARTMRHKHEGAQYELNAAFVTDHDDQEPRDEVVVESAFVAQEDATAFLRVARPHSRMSTYRPSAGVIKDSVAAEWRPREKRPVRAGVRV